MLSINDSLKSTSQETSFIHVSDRTLISIQILKHFIYVLRYYRMNLLTCYPADDACGKLPEEIYSRHLTGYKINLD